MEERKLNKTWLWIGSILIALLVLGSLGFGAYRLYAMGWARGAATTVVDGEVAESPQMTPPLPMQRGYRMGGHFSIWRIVLPLVLIGMVIRHFAWRRHAPKYGWAPGPGRGWSHWHPGCDPRQPYGDDIADETEGAA